MPCPLRKWGARQSILEKPPGRSRTTCCGRSCPRGNQSFLTEVTLSPAQQGKSSCDSVDWSLRCLQEQKLLPPATAPKGGVQGGEQGPWGHRTWSPGLSSRPFTPSCIPSPETGAGHLFPHTAGSRGHQPLPWLPRAPPAFLHGTPRAP